MSNPIRIVHVLSRLGFGGTEVNTVRLAQALARRGFEQTLVVMTDRVDPELARRIDLPLFYPPRSLRFPRGVFYLGKILNETQAQLIHGRGVVTWLDCVAARQVARHTVRAVQSFHGTRTFSQKQWSRKLLAALLSDQTGVFVAVGNHLAAQMTDLWNLDPHKIQVIPNGIDLAAFQPQDRAAAKQRLGLDPKTYVIGNVGSLFVVKNQTLLIRALAGLTAKISDCALLLIGDGPCREQLHRQTAQLGLERQVRFYGYQNDVQPYWQAMDAYVQTSLDEGSPTAVLEAMASQLPVVATNSEGCLELHQTVGLPILTPHNDHNAIIKHLLDWHEHPDGRHDLGQAGRRAVAACYSFDRMVDQYEALYQRLIQDDGVS